MVQCVALRDVLRVLSVAELYMPGWTRPLYITRSASLHSTPSLTERGRERERESGNKTYADHRELATTAPEFPFGHATVSGFRLMLPPQAKPAQVRDTGAMISRMVSKGTEAVTGTAMRKVGLVPGRTTWR